MCPRFTYTPTPLAALDMGTCSLVAYHSFSDADLYVYVKGTDEQEPFGNGP
jgi:hypothetical protein